MSQKTDRFVKISQIAGNDTDCIVCLVKCPLKFLGFAGTMDIFDRIVNHFDRIEDDFYISGDVRGDLR